MRNRAWRWPTQRTRRHTMHGTLIRSCSVLAAAALSFSAWKLVGAGARKPRPSSDFSRKPAQPAHLSPCATLLKPLGCTVGVASSPLPCRAFATSLLELPAAAELGAAGDPTVFARAPG